MAGYLEACPLATVSNGGGHLPSFLPFPGNRSIGGDCTDAGTNTRWKQLAAGGQSRDGERREEEKGRERIAASPPPPLPPLATL